MKVILILIASLAGIYSIFAVVQLVRAFTVSNSDSAYGISNIAASVVPVVLGFAVCLVCLQKALAKTKSIGKSKDGSSKDGAGGRAP